MMKVSLKKLCVSQQFDLCSERKLNHKRTVIRILRVSPVPDFLCCESLCQCVRSRRSSFQFFFCCKQDSQTKLCVCGSKFEGSTGVAASSLVPADARTCSFASLFRSQPLSPVFFNFLCDVQRVYWATGFLFHLSKQKKDRMIVTVCTPLTGTNDPHEQIRSVLPPYV